ncbi:hypothetical protein AMATHDRAFT_139144 [Amanita thiersii Skay4041]|uniref:U3 small nucleolar RNA-associated protein 15 C-terminal domain-containing protein n=1 Tax=Amanita thiersii Skay4041 TaxID=703135 RepID=A0A2A9NWQ3_9AGAR|nr:hypothetical protein AMATHDRAFT_139144 [Amanita thiersii Skay4041]
MEYQPVALKTQPSSTKHNPESRYWRLFKYPVFIKEYAPVTSIHFSPAKPHNYAVTAATRVQIYAPRTQKVTKSISRFKDVARSGNIRSDGKLMVAGDDSGLIQIFDLSSRAILRTLDSHKQPVHVVKFSHLTPTHVLSCSDDTTVKLWDVPSQSIVTTFTSHTDYVRTGQVSTSNPSLILTGSYDATVRLHDTRSGQCEMLLGGPGAKGTAGSVPVEQVLMFPSGTAALSASGSILRVWDIVAGGRCIRALSNHQKTITALTFDTNAGRVLTGGLDHLVKVYDVSTYKVVHTMHYPAPLLCLALSPDATHIVAGMADGTLSVRRRQQKPAGVDSFLNASIPTIGDGIAKVQNSSQLQTSSRFDELKIESRRTKRLKDYDKLLKSFKYSAALDSVLRKQVPPNTAFSLIQELIHRDGLKSALAGRDDVLLEPILRLLVKYVTDPRFGRLVCDISILVLEMYGTILGQSPLIDTLFLRLRKKVIAEIRFQALLQKTQGSLNMVLASVNPGVAL